MPETFFHIRWPDDVREACYSPSSVIEQHLETRTYSVAEFVAASRRGLKAASERVQAVYGGYGCSRAIAQFAAIEAKAKAYDGDATVCVERLGGTQRRSA